MKLARTEKIFNSETGTKTFILGCECAYSSDEIAVSVDDGKITATGKLDKDSASFSIGFMNLQSGEICSEAEDGIFSVIGSETLYSITFSAESKATATVKILC